MLLGLQMWLGGRIHGQHEEDPGLNPHHQSINTNLKSKIDTSWGDSSVDKMLVLYVWGPEFEPQARITHNWWQVHVIPGEMGSEF